MTKLLILTAGFGEGHNAAPQSRRAGNALQGPEPRCPSIFLPHFATLQPVAAAPTSLPSMALLASGALSIGGSTKHEVFPRHLWLLRQEFRQLDRLVQREQPRSSAARFRFTDFCSNGCRLGPPGRAFYNVVTDSISINSLWARPPARAGLSPMKRPPKSCAHRVCPQLDFTSSVFPSRLFQPASPHPQSARPRCRRRAARAHHHALRRPPRLCHRAPAAGRVRLGTDLRVGRDERLRQRLEHLAAGRHQRTQILGWTDEVPRLLMTHHVVISKAGGATTQEAIAARCPMLVNQVVPGQEEGNYELLRRRGAGALVETPKQWFRRCGRRSQPGAVWREWRMRSRPWPGPTPAGTSPLTCSPESPGHPSRPCHEDAFHLQSLFRPEPSPSAARSRPPGICRRAAARRSHCLYRMSGPRHGTRPRRTPDGCERIVAVGGDGTMNEIAQALVGSRPPSPSCLAARATGWPCISVCHPAPPLPRAAGRRHRRVVAIDTGTANGHPFFNAMGLGFDAEISRRFNRLTRRGLWRTRARDWRPSSGTAPSKLRYPTATAPGDVCRLHRRRGQLRSIWQPRPVAPGARVDDGLLDLVRCARQVCSARCRSWHGSFSEHSIKVRESGVCAVLTLSSTAHARSDPHGWRDASDCCNRECRRPPAQPATAGGRRMSDRLLHLTGSMQLDHEYARKHPRPFRECRVGPSGRTVCARQSARRQATVLHLIASIRPAQPTMDKKRLRVRTVIISDVHLGTTNARCAK